MKTDPVKELQERIRLQNGFDKRVKKLLKKVKTHPCKRRRKKSQETIIVHMPVTYQWFCTEKDLPYRTFMRIIENGYIAPLETLGRIDAALKSEGF